MVAVKALVQVDFPTRTNKTPNKEAKCPNVVKFKTLPFCQNVFLWHQDSSCKYSMCLHCIQCVYIVYAKYQVASVKVLVQVGFPGYALSEQHKQNLI